MHARAISFRTYGFKAFFIAFLLFLTIPTRAQTEVRTDAVADTLSPSRQQSAPSLASSDPNRTGLRGAPGVLPQQSTDDLNRSLMYARGPAKPEAPNQFQLFVQEATGKLLPHFGAALFDAPQSYVPDAGLAAPASYILGPGDEIRLQVWGSVDISLALVLDRNGQVQIPRVGVVSLAGVTVGELAPTLKAQLAKVITNFNLNANLGRLRSIQVYVVGQAQAPGAYQLSSLSTLVTALFASGGPSANGSMRAIQLSRSGSTLATLDLYDFIAKGDKTQDLPLQNGDVIVIPPVGPRVALICILVRASA